MVDQDPGRIDPGRLLEDFADKVLTTDATGFADLFQKLKDLLSSPIRVYGTLTERAFLEVACSLGKVGLVQRLDQRLYRARKGTKVPDYIIESQGNRYVVEVKNYSPSHAATLQKQTTFTRFSEQYYEALSVYADTIGLPLLIAVYWRNWNRWTLNASDVLAKIDGRRVLSFADALTYDLMGELLGDKMIATLSPLRWRLAIKPVPLAFPQTSLTVTITGSTMYCQDAEITDAQIRGFTLMLMNHGNWHSDNPVIIDTDGVAYAIEFTATAPEEERLPPDYPRVVVHLSQLIMSYFRNATENETGMPRLSPRWSMPKATELIPEDPFHRGLPLWILNTVSARKDQA